VLIRDRRSGRHGVAMMTVEALGFWGTVGANILSGIAVALVIATLGVVVARVFTRRWQDAQARRDRDLAGVVDFYRAYAEFFATWKVWNTYQPDRHPDLKLNQLGDGQRFDLLQAASRAEAGIEFMLLRIAAERSLSNEEAAALWCLRTAAKELRYAMRNKHALNWWRTPRSAHQPGYDAYQAFKSLSSFLARLLVDSEGRRELPSRRDARERHSEITGNLEQLAYVKQLQATDKAQLTAADKDTGWVLLFERLEQGLLEQGRPRPWPTWPIEFWRRWRPRRVTPLAKR
jgi:hypothetical protein